MAYSNKALPPGTILREWRLEHVLGVGGFGIVYKGRGIYFDELVAIKEYFPSAISERVDGDTVVPTDSDAEEIHALGLKKFVEEAKLLWNLSKPTRHPNIVSVRSLFEIHGTAYMVMDFEDGRSLSEILKAGRSFTETSLMALIRPISEGLDRAHRVGVLHRDIKPPNILVNEDGRPVLIDFGSARFESGQATSTTVTFHTPPYAAIEQYVKTYEQGPWTDVYALAVVLYECVTGSKPPEVLERLHGGNSTALADGEWPSYSRAFLRAIDAGMTIRPSDRPQTISQWLALFDLDENAPLPEARAVTDDAPTRFEAFRDLPAEIIPVQPPMPIEASAAAPPADPSPGTATAPTTGTAPHPTEVRPGSARSPAMPPPKRKGPVATLLALGLGTSILGGAYLLTRPDRTSTPVAGATVQAGFTATPDNAPEAPPVSGTAIASGGTVEALHTLAAEARRAAIAPAALKAYEAAVAKADTLAATPESAKPRATALGEIDALAKPAGSALARAVEAGVSEQARRLAGKYQWLASGNVVATTTAQKSAAQSLRSAQQRVAAAAAGSAAAATAADALSATRATLVAAGAFTSAAARVHRAADVPVPKNLLPSEAATTASASPSPAPSKAPTGMGSRFSEVDAIVSSARPLAARVIELGNTGRPGPGASIDDRKGYTTRQANGRRAREYMTHLELLSRTVRSAPSEAAVAGYVAQARLVKGYLNTILASSLAAMPK